MGVDVLAAPGVTADDLALLASFETLRLAPEAFDHLTHVRTGWIYLKTRAPLDALRDMAVALRRFATAAGKPERYHETITWAWLLLLRERIAQGPADETWEAFLARNADVRGNALLAHYDAAELARPEARAVFVLPRR